MIDVNNQIRKRLTQRFTDMGEVEVKNVPDPVRGVRVLGGGEMVATPSWRINPRQKIAAAIIVAVALVDGAGKISEALSETESAKSLGPTQIGTVETATVVSSTDLSRNRF